MTDLQLIRKLAINWGVAQTDKECPGEARFVTGKPKIDALIHYFEQESGLEITLSDDNNSIDRYVVVDHEKLVWFTLKWS